MNDTINSDSELIIAQNKEEWGKLLFLLEDKEPNVFWINCDTARLKRPLHDAITQYFPQLKPYDIYIDEKTESLTTTILWEEKDKIPKDAIIHIFGLEDAVKNTEFLGNLNFLRDSLFRKTPAHIIFWADFDTGTLLMRRAYDFWSWVFFSFDFKTPDELLTARQKDFREKLILQNTTIPLHAKDSYARTNHLEHEWCEFMKSVNGKPSTVKQMMDAVTISRALAFEYSDEGKHQKAIKTLERVLELNPELNIERDRGQLWNDLGTSYFSIGDIGKAKDLYEKALTLNIKLLGESNIEVATNKSNLAMAYKELGDFQKAKGLLEESLATFISVNKNNHSGIDTIESNLAMVYQELGDYEKARILLEKAFENNLKTLGECHPDTSIKMSNLAIVYRDLGNFYKAKDLLEKALNCDLKNFNRNHPNVELRYYNLAYVYLDLNQKNKARECMQKVYEIRNQMLGIDNPKTQNALNFLKNLDQPTPKTPLK